MLAIYTSLIHNNHGYDPWVEENMLHEMAHTHKTLNFDRVLSFSTSTFSTKAKVHQFIGRFQVAFVRK